MLGLPATPTLRLGDPMTDIAVRGPEVDRSHEILTTEALDFVADLQRRFGARRDDLLTVRRER